MLQSLQLFHKKIFALKNKNFLSTFYLGKSENDKKNSKIKENISKPLITVDDAIAIFCRFIWKRPTLYSAVPFQIFVALSD